MSLLHRIYTAIKGERISQISVQAMEQEKPSKLSRRDLYTLYASCPPLKRAIDIRATLASNFISIQSDNQAAVDKVISTLSPTAGLAKLKKIIFNSSVQADVEGAGFVELHLDDNLRPSLSLIHSQSIDYQRDERGRILYQNGKPKALVQEIDNFQKITIPYDHISALRYNEYGDEPYGLPLTQLVSSQAQGYIDALNGFANALNKLGFPIYDFSIGDEMNPPNAQIIRDVQRAVRNFNNTKEFVHEHFIKPTITESKYISQSTDFDKPFIRSISIASGVPEFLLTGETRELSLASSRIMTEILPKILLPSMQGSIETFTEDIFSKLSEASGEIATTNIIFKPIFSGDQISSAQRAQILSSIPNLCSREELRKIAGLDPE